MKKLLIIFLVLSFFLISCQNNVIPYNSGSYIIKDPDSDFIIRITYHGLNGSLYDIEKLNTEVGTTIELNGGDSSFKAIDYEFSEAIDIDSLNLKIQDSLSEPMNNCQFFICDNTAHETLNSYTGKEIISFSNGQIVPINRKIKSLRLFFSSKNTVKNRIINIHNFTEFHP